MKKMYLIPFSLTIILNLLSSASFGQEICNNGIDDDGDGFADCVDGDCAFIAECDGVLPCSNSLYQVISGVLKIFDPVNSSYQDIGATSFGSYNGAGYNVEDGYIYAIKKYSNANHMLKIDAYGDGVDLGPIASWTGINYCADVDQYGNWIAFTSGTNPQLRTIDLDQLPLQMTLQPLQNLSGASIPNTADITYNPIQEKYYGMSKNFDLLEIDPVAMTIDIVWNENLSTNNFGAAWSDSEGNSYFSNNATGEISRVRFDQSGNPYERMVVAYGEITNNNDGMNCTLSLPPFETNCSDGIDNDGDGLIDGEDPDCVEAPPLVEVTDDPVVNIAFDSWGITAIDYNQDGYDDIYVPAYDPAKKSKLYLNDGSGNFTEHQGDAVANDLLPSIGASWGDFDNDGQVDLAVANNNGAPIKLYRNSNQSFSDQSAQLEGLTDGYSHNICFVDYDRDGWLDLFASDYFSSKFNQLYRNKGDGSMERVYDLEVVEEATGSIGAIWADVNNDGWPDCFVPNYGTSNFLFINQEGKSFTKIDMGGNFNSVGASFGDFDNDQDLDLFVANASNQSNLLYTNDGAGNFTQVTTGWVAGDKGNSHGSVWADLDNDGWQDLIVMNDQDGSKFLYMNNGDGTFGKVTNSPFISPQGNSFSIVSTDLELDGDLDLVISNHSSEKNKIFRNDLANGNYLLVRLEGTNSNRSAIGARIYIEAVIDGVNQTLMREVMGQTGGGPSSQSSLTQHFGLGDASNISSVEVHWPSGYVQTLENQAINQLLDIREDDGAIVGGYVYHDENDNCVKDANEQALSNTLIKINSGSLYAMTDESGYYEVSLPLGGYSIQQEVPTNFESTCQPGAHSINVTSVGQTFGSLDFPNKGISAEPDLSVELSTTALRRGFENEMVLTYANIAADDAYNVTIDVTLDEPLTLAEASVPWTTQAGNTYTWQIDTVKAGEQTTIQLLNYVDLSTELGEVKNLEATIGTSQTEITYDNNDYSLADLIVGSLDPNDILVTPVGIGSSHLIHPETRLNYKIRFQNVGNYPAAYVTVLDTLPEQLDPSTLRLAGASHSFQFEMLDKNVLKWYFHDINLVDSVSNEPESHGFVKFSIKPMPDLEQGTKIVNRAAIKFDFNPFIITNQCLSSINLNAVLLDDEFSLTVFPNPAENRVECYLLNQDSYRKGEMKDRGNFRIDILDQSGTVQISNRYDTPASIQELDISRLSSGLYIVQYEDDLGTIKRTKLIKRL